MNVICFRAIPDDEPVEVHPYVVGEPSSVALSLITWGPIVVARMSATEARELAAKLTEAADESDDVPPVEHDPRLAPSTALGKLARGRLGL